MASKIKKKTLKRKTIDEYLPNEVYNEAINYIHYISRIKKFDSIDILPLNKKSVKSNLNFFVNIIYNLIKY